MKILTTISPAETLFLLNPGSSKFKDLMKYTFMDLLLKKVIELKEINSDSTDQTIGINTNVIAGRNFQYHKVKKHELIFLGPFLKSPTIQILFIHYIKMAYETSGGQSIYKKSIKASSEIESFFKDSFVNKVFGLNKLTEEGKKLKLNLQDFLDKLDNQVLDLLVNDTEKSLELLKPLNGNILLLKNLDFKHLKKVDKELIRQQKLKHADSYDSDDHYWLYFDYLEDNSLFDFHEIIDSFDTEFDSSDESSSDSSCDSGCSSCGGCGD